MAVGPMRARASEHDARRTEALHPELLPALRVELARAVARSDHGYLLDRDNERVSIEGRVSWTIPKAIAHVEAQRAPSYFVDVRDDVLALDADKANASEAIRTIVVACVGAELHPVVLESGGEDHQHLFVHVLDATVRAALETQARGLKLDVRRSIRPPGAPHRRGGAVRLVSHTTWEEALDALGGPRTPPPRWTPQDAPRATPEAPRTSPAAPRRPLSPNMVALLKTGRHPDPERPPYRSRSEVVMALALGAVNARWSENDLLAALLDPRNEGGDRVREMHARNASAAIRYVAGRYAKAQARAAQRPVIQSGTGLATLDTIAAAVERAPWNGTTGATDRKVMLAHVELARLAGGPIHYAAVRDVAERAEVTTATVGRSRVRLGAAGWLDRVKAWRKIGDAGQWKVLGGAHHEHTESSPRGCETVCRFEHPPQGLWRRRTGLGPVAERIYQVLGSEPQSRPAIAAALQRAKKDTTLRRWLPRLKAWGLAETCPDGRWVRGAADPVKVAEEMEATEADKRHRARHAADRKRFREELSERRTRFRTVKGGQA